MKSTAVYRNYRAVIFIFPLHGMASDNIIISQTHSSGDLDGI